MIGTGIMLALIGMRYVNRKKKDKSKNRPNPENKRD